MLRQVVSLPLLTRLATREYLPLAAMLAAWGVFGLALGHADAVRLFAAYTFLHALRSLCALEMTATLARRVGAEDALRRSRAKALRIDFLVLLAALAVTALLASLLWWRGMTAAAGMLLLVAVGLPARHPGGVLIARRVRELAWRMGSALTVVVGAALVWLLDLQWWHAALVLGLKEWGSLLFTALFARKRPDSNPPMPEPLSFAELAARTEASAKRRLTYRMAKSVLGGLLGPVGTVIARTGRGARLDGRISRMIPRHRGGMVTLTLVSSGAMLFFLLLGEPATLVLASASARIAASGGSALLWWSYGNTLDPDEEDDED